MDKVAVIIISGPPCTGKTTLSRFIVEQTGLPLVTKDNLKELLFDGLGWQDRAWSRKLGGVSYDLLYHFIETLLIAKQSLIVESNFAPEIHTPKFLALQQKYPFDLYQLLCHTEGEVLLERLKKRATSGERHPGHQEHLQIEELKETLLKGYYEPLAIGGKVLEVDTTDFTKINYATITSFLSSFINYF